MSSAVQLAAYIGTANASVQLRSDFSVSMAVPLANTGAVQAHTSADTDPRAAVKTGARSASALVNEGYAQRE